MFSYPEVVAFAVVLLVAIGIWLLLKIRVADRRLAEVETRKLEAEKAARLEAERLKKERLLEARDQIFNWRSEAESKIQERRRKCESSERRIADEQGRLDRLQKEVDEVEKKVAERLQETETRSEALALGEERLEGLIQDQKRQLEQTAGITAEEAKKSLIKAIEGDAMHEAAHLAKRIEEEARENADKQARKIISQAIQRCAAEHAVESSVAVVDLPSDDMKGRIIGREGRNIRALEQATGVDLIVDDTPEAIIVSGFDPMRREIAKLSIEHLIKDGRIHPARIEEVVERVDREMEQHLFEEGESVLFELGIHDFPKELVRLIGRLKFRTSYGQNVLYHSREVASLAAIMAGELGVDVEISKRAGLLHDIGKAVDREMEGTHLQLGVELARKFQLHPDVIHGIEAHHFDVEFRTIEAVLVQAADAISASRPGARREVLESYVKRLEKLEEIAAGFNGVAKAFALQAGREIRIIVESSKVTDEQSFWLTKDIAKKIEKDLQYPGQIKVTLIRETRVVDYAK